MPQQRMCSSCSTKKADIYHTTGDFCTKCFSDGVAKAKAKIYAHLLSIGLGRRVDESKTDWLSRVRQHYQRSREHLRRKARRSND